MLPVSLNLARARSCSRVSVRRVALAFETRQRCASHSEAATGLARIHSRNSSRVVAGLRFRFGTILSCFSS